MPNDQITPKREATPVHRDVRIEAALHLYSEHSEDRRHYEDQREKITHCVLLLSIAILALFKLVRGSEAVDIGLAVILVLLGVFGAYMTHDLCRKVALKTGCLDDCVEPIRELGPPFNFDRHSDDKLEGESDMTRRAWVILNLLVSFVGAAILLMRIL